MCALLESFWINPTFLKGSEATQGMNLFHSHFLWERTQHQLALQKGYTPPDSLVHFWKRRFRRDYRLPPPRPTTNSHLKCAKTFRFDVCDDEVVGAPETEGTASPERSDWAIDTLLISGYDLFQLLGKKTFFKAVKKMLNVPDRVLIPLVPTTSLDVCVWTAYQKIPTSTRLEFNATAYELTADRCKVIKDIELDPPRRVAAPSLLEVLLAFTAADTAQLIIEYAVSPYLPNHLRCCASTIKNHRCPSPRFKRYCSIPVGCCAGFQIAPNTCLYDVCSFHLLKSNGTRPTYSLVSCD